MVQENRVIFDIECDNLLFEVTKIHCLSYSYENEEEVHSLTDEEEIKDLLQQDNITLIGHYITMYDIPVLEKLLHIKITAPLIDTCALSWYLEPQRSIMNISHGLAKYGEEFGIKKPEIGDWTNLTTAEYVHRCSEDVKINKELWNRQREKLMRLYNNDRETITRLINYLMFKMDCLREQQDIGIRLDIKKCQNTLAELEEEKAKKVAELTAAMPKIPIKTTRVYPKVFYKKDGSLSSHGEKWIALCKEKGLPEDHKEDIEVIMGWEEGNPNSHEQIKSWLYSLGWKPEHIKQVRDKKTNTFREIPQIASKEGGGDICPSIIKLIEKEPSLEALNGLTVISHRISIFKGFLEEQKEGRLYPTASGFTNTLRLQHSIVVNLPGVDKKYGELIRGSLIADEKHILINSDLNNIEDKTKRHFIYVYDPAYVEEMNSPDFDAHLDIGIRAGFLTEDEVSFYKSFEQRQEDGEVITEEEVKTFKRIKTIRQKSKQVNFSATYKVGSKTLSRNSGLPLKEAEKLLDIYWKRNKAILDVENSLSIKTVDGQKWQLNPVSGFWYSLRADKDKFSTLNQGTAVYVFDMYLMFLRKEYKVKIAYQCHDEWLGNVPEGEEELYTKYVEKAIEKVNNLLKLNVQVGAGCEFGHNYAQVH